MKKTLLLAAMFLSSAAQAETYVCTSTYGVLIANEKTINASQRTWIADASLGLRLPSEDGTDKSYEGECEKNSDTNLVCSSKKELRIDTILINTTDLTFTTSSLFNTGGWVHSGKCVAI
jgi:hypothetical protein